MGELAERLTFLFDHVRNPETKEDYRLRDVVEYLESIGVKTSEQHISQLRRGAATNPSLAVARGIAAFFGQDLDFFAEWSPVYEQMKAVVAAHGELTDMEEIKRAAGAAQLTDDQRVFLRAVDRLDHPDLRAQALALVEQLAAHDEHAHDEHDDLADGNGADTGEYPAIPRFLAPNDPRRGG